MKYFINSLGKNEMDYIAHNWINYEKEDLKNIILECLYLMDKKQLEELKENLEEL